MRKVLLIAAREYQAAVRTKAFLISLLLMPLMMGGSILLQLLVKDVVDVRDKHFALIDRTVGQKLAGLIEGQVRQYNQAGVLDPQTHQQVKPRFVIERVPSGPASAEAIARQRYELSERVRQGKLFGFLEILDPADGRPVTLRYQSNRPAADAFPQMVEAIVVQHLRDELARRARLSPAQEEALVKPAVLDSKGLSTLNPRTHAIEEAPEHSRVAGLLIPGALMMLMFMVILMSATPLMQGVVEEKMQRIAEVLLGSVRPFELMLGKLLGMVAVSLTIAAVYLGGVFWAAHRYGFAEFVGYDLLAWFVVLQVLAALMYGSLFVAIGAACTDMRETQNLMWPVMLLACLPLFILGNVLREPNSPLVTGMSFFPFATPMLLIARQAVPPGLPWWQAAGGALLVLATTAVCVYAAGRIFRVGLLLQGKGARLGEILRWVVRG